MGTKVRLSVACGDCEIVRALKEGAVPEGAGAVSIFAVE